MLGQTGVTITVLATLNERIFDFRRLSESFTRMPCSIRPAYVTQGILEGSYQNQSFLIHDQIIKVATILSAWVGGGVVVGSSVLRSSKRLPDRE